MSRLRLIAAPALVTVFAGMGAGVAAAYWATTDSTHPALAVADTMPAGPQPTLTGIDGRDVTISWATTATPGGRPVLGYTVSRYWAPSGGSATTASGGCASTVATISCTEQDAPAGTWYYAITPRIHNWAGVEGGRSAAVTVISAAMVVTPGQTLPSLPGTIAGASITRFKANETVTFRLDAAVGPTLGAGVSSVDGAGAASGFTVDIPATVSDGAHTIVAVGGSGSQAVSNTFTVNTSTPVVTVDSVSSALLGPSQTSTIVRWHADTSGTYSVRIGGTSCVSGTVLATAAYVSSTQSVTTVVAADLTEGANTLRICVSDPFSHTGSTTTVVSLDTQGPTGGSLTYVDGYYGTASVAVTLSNGTDTPAGIAAGGRQLQRAVTSLVGGSCTLPFGGFALLVADPPTSPAYPDTTVVGGNCYQYRYLVVDNVGNAVTYTSGAVARVDTSAPSFGSPALTLTAGSNAYVSGTTVFYNASLGAGFTVAASNAGDPQSALSTVSFPIIGSGLSGGGAQTGPTYSATYTASAGATATGSRTVTATNNALLTATTGFTVAPDGQAPTGGSLAVNGGTAATVGSSTYSTSGSFSISRTDFTDAGAGLSSSTLTRATASLVANSCGSFAAPAVLAGAPAQSGLANGCYRYALTGTDNVGNMASLTSVVMVDTTAPSPPTLAFTGLTNSFYNSATGTLWLRPAAGGAFTVTGSSSDADTGIAGYAFGSLNANGGSNFSNTQTAGANAYTFGASTTAPSGQATVLATNNAGASSGTTGYGISTDTAAPTAPTPTVTAGYYTTASVPVPVGAATDTGSGVGTVTLRRDQAALSAGLCSLFPGTFGTAVVLSGGIDTSVAPGFCYQYRLVVVDNVGNQTTSGLSGIAKVETTAPTTPTLSFLSLTNTGASGTTVSMRSSQNAGTFTVLVTSADPETGVTYSFPTFPVGWTAVTAGASRTYTWAGPNMSPPSGAQTITVTNGAGLVSTVSFTVVADNTNPALANVIMANGGTAGTIDQGDSVAVTFSEEMDASKFCPVWTNGVVQTLNDVTVTVVNHGGHDEISVTSTSCPTLNVATAASPINTNTNYVVTNVPVTFDGTVSWNPAVKTITITFGTLRGGGSAVLTGLTAVKFAKFGPPAGLADVAGNGLPTANFTAPTTSAF